jgi:hypothetical protein
MSAVAPMSGCSTTDPVWRGDSGSNFVDGDEALFAKRQDLRLDRHGADIARELSTDNGYQGRMRHFVCRHDKPARAGMQRLPLDTGHHASCGLTQRDPACEVHAVLQGAIGHVCGPPASPDPRDRQRCGDHARPELFGELRICK